MTTKTRLFFTSLLLLVTATGLAALPTDVGGAPVTSLAPLVEKASPAVVNIRVSQNVSQGNDWLRRFYNLPESHGGSREIASAGSGVIVDAERGFILTNHHVVKDADEIQISLFDGEILEAEIIGSDAATDIALLKVDADGLVEMPIGDSEAVRVGDFVLAIGNPFGLGHTVTSGIVSALGRTGISRDGYEDFIQTDASINPGNSGGALVNMHGELVGINSAIISRSGGNVGIGMRQILDFGEVRRGLLGVTISGIDAEVAEALNASVDSGALITMIESGSAAEDSGLQVDDIIVAVNNKKISDASELRNAIGLMGSGEDIDISYIRNGKNRNVKATLGQQSVARSTGTDIHPGLAGATFASSTATNTGGVEVTEVASGSPAAQRGLRAGDIITAVNRRSIRNLQQLAELAAGNRILFLLVRRGDRALMLQIR